MEACKLKSLGLCCIAALFVSTQALADNITNVKVSVERLAHLSHGEQVNVSFNYATNYSGKVRIFVRPMTQNNPSPNYSAQGSKTYTAKKGRGRGGFTITKGDILVDRIRIRIVTDEGKGRYTKYVPVKLKFSKEPVKILPVLQVVDLPKLEIVGALHPAGGGGDVKRTILPDGSVEIRYPDGRRKILFEGGHKIIYPDGREQRYSYMSVQVDVPPLLPSQPSIVAWLEGMNNNLLNMIGTLVDGNQQALDYYTQKENEKTANLYEKIQLRTAYINRLLSN